MLYIFRKGEQLGPYSEENIQTFLKIGSVEYTDFVWQEGWKDWKPLAEVFPPSPTPPPLPTPEPKPYQSVRMVGTKDHHEPPTIRASSGKNPKNGGETTPNKQDRWLEKAPSDHRKTRLCFSKKTRSDICRWVLLARMS